MKFLPMLGHDLEMSYTKFYENRLIIDGEINEKHALQIIVSWTLVEAVNSLYRCATRYSSCLPLIGLNGKRSESPGSRLDHSPHIDVSQVNPALSL